MASKLILRRLRRTCSNPVTFIPGSQIYGGLSNSWDYGPLGAELKKNIKGCLVETFRSRVADQRWA
jgi:glycyl-tRNA synthetase